MDLMSSLFSAGSPQTQAPVDTSASTYTPNVPQPQSHDYEEQDGKHMGLAGTGRDILGFLGDFLLKKIGMPAMYAPAQQNRQLSAAWQGHEDDPQAAADRVSDIDFNRGTALGNQQKSFDSLSEYRQSAEQRRLAAIADAQDKMKNRNEDRTNGMLQSLFDKDGNFDANKYAMMKPTIDKLYPGQNLPETTNGEDIRTRIGGTLGAKNQIDEQFRQGKEESSEDYKNRVIQERTNFHGRTGDQRDVALQQAERGLGIRQQVANAGDTRNTETEARDNAAHVDRLRGQDLNKGKADESDLTKRRGQNMKNSPPVGYKNKWGAAYTGGDPTIESNWKK